MGVREGVPPPPPRNVPKRRRKEQNLVGSDPIGTWNCGAFGVGSGVVVRRLALLGVQPVRDRALMRGLCVTETRAMYRGTGAWRAAPCAPAVDCIHRGLVEPLSQTGGGWPWVYLKTMWKLCSVYSTLLVALHL